jgi:hydrogenase maturation protease
LVRPETILAMARRYFGAEPQAFLLAIRGYEFEFVEALTPGASDNLRQAAAMLADRIRAVHAEVA